MNKALAVIDHLKDYRPKRHIPGTPKGLKSGRITPTFVFGRNTGKRTPPFGPAGAPRSGTPDLSFEADVEDLGYITGSDTEKVKRKMFLGLGTTRKSKIAPRRMPTSPTMRAPGANSAGPSRNVSDDFDNVVRNQSNQHPHTYPPTAPLGARQGPAATDDAPEAKVLAQAAKVLKAAALHDARNIKGKDTTEADVSFTITSPHEAKVGGGDRHACTDRPNTNTFRTPETSPQPLLRFPRGQETHLPYSVGFLSRISQCRGCEGGLQNF